MASNETGECCVCGKETTQKCGACAEADFSLFFCSRECQKLIWPVHKRVCGPGRCNPFLWPELTKEEAEAAKTHLHWTPPGYPTRRTLSMLLRGTADVPAGLHSALLDGLVEGSETPSALILEPGQAKQHTLLTTRVMEHTRRDHPIRTAADALQLASAMSFTYLATSPTGAFFRPPPPWLSAANHFVLVWSAIRWRIAQAYYAGDRPLKAQLAGYRASCEGRIREFAKQSVVATHPHTADRMLKMVAEGKEAYEPVTEVQ
ncbi:hypothetical protein JCM10213_005385 [Rhodosporidiobolus nylandii]